MTEEQQKELVTLEAQVHQVLLLCKNLKTECTELKQQNEELKQRNAELKREIEDWKQQCETLNLVRAFGGGNGADFKEAKDTLSQMVKEIDECIAMLNA
ncbi:hypothetical protein AGMMS4957_13210 [Bacteroidia bacterium]|nr:hypothetical protein AGMMS4957_13210 [Bacteroidia bacterium]